MTRLSLAELETAPFSALTCLGQRMGVEIRYYIFPLTFCAKSFYQCPHFRIRRLFLSLLFSYSFLVIFYALFVCSVLPIRNKSFINAASHVSDCLRICHASF